MFNKKQLILTIFKISLKAVIATVIAIIIIVFSSQQISKISNSLKEQRTAAFILEKKTETISQLREDFNLVDEADRKISDAFPPADNILGFVTSLENLASQNGLQQTISFGTPADSSIDYNLTLNANIFTLINYLKNFEKLPYFTGISSINLNAPSGWEGNSTISIRAKVYTK